MNVKMNQFFSIKSVACSPSQSGVIIIFSFRAKNCEKSFYS